MDSSIGPKRALYWADANSDFPDQIGWSFVCYSITAVRVPHEFYVRNNEMLSCLNS